MMLCPLCKILHETYKDATILDLYIGSYTYIFVANYSDRGSRSYEQNESNSIHVHSLDMCDHANCQELMDLYCHRHSILRYVVSMVLYS